MLIRLFPPSPYSPILYELTFPCVLPLESLGPGATIPVAWASQLQLLTSLLQLEPPSSIHMLDRAVGLVARTRELSMDVPRKEISVKFVDGRVVNIPMNSDCVRILLGVVLDVKGCNDAENQRNSTEGSACTGSIANSTEDLPSPSSPTKSPKLGRHKRQRSLLFSLISSLVPKSFSSPSSPSSPPPTAPPPTPLPPLPAGRVTSPLSPQRTSFTSSQLDPDLLRQRARATLIDVWRRHVITALSLQHLPPAGYAEWTLIAIASKVRAELESLKTAKLWNHDFGISNRRMGGSKHRRAQIEGRNALDFGDRSDSHGSERCRAPSPLPGVWDVEDNDRVVYPRRDKADEWGVRCVDYSTFPDEVDIFEVEFNGQNDSLLSEHFMVGDEWDDNEQLAFELSRMRRYVSGIDIRSSGLREEHLHTVDLGPDYGDDYGGRLVDATFDMSRTPLVPSDVNDSEESDGSQTTLRTPEEGEEFFLTPPEHMLQSTQLATHSAPQPPSVSRVTSSRPRSRNAQHPWQVVRPVAPSCTHDDSGDAQLDEIIYSHCEHLDRISTALDIVRSRAREEGWRLVRAMTIGAKNGWMDPETERTLEMRAKRRAWSSGIKIHAPYTYNSRFLRSRRGNLSVLRSLMSPPGLASSSRGTSQVRGPIVPTGLSLGIPLQSSPLAAYIWDVDDGQTSSPGLLNTMHTIETVEGKRSSRVTFSDSVTKLFPVCEDEGEDLSEPVKVNAVSFPHGLPLASSVDGSEKPADGEEDPFYFYPSQPRTRTTSMYAVFPAPSSHPSPSLPVFQTSTPPPSYQTIVGGNVSTAASDEEKGLDASALLLQPLLSLSIPPSGQLPSSRSHVARPRAVSLPTIRPCPSANMTRRTSLRHGEERCQDLSRTYASPPPEGPLVISTTPAPHEQYPRYAHVSPPISTGGKGINASILGRTGKEMVFEQAGSEFAVGIEVALGRAEEGRVIW